MQTTITQPIETEQVAQSKKSRFSWPWGKKQATPGQAPAQAKAVKPKAKPIAEKQPVTLASIWKSIITWQWTKVLLYWLIISAGTMSELAFLLASLWISVNSSVHALVLLAFSQAETVHFTEFSTAAYVALPELILGLACVTTINHLRMFLYSKDYTALLWTILYAGPTIIFFILSVFTLGSAVLSATFVLPDWMLVTRALSAFIFALTSLIYWQLGTPQEHDRLAKKDEIIAKLTENIASMTTEYAASFTAKQAEYTASLAGKDSEIERLNSTISDFKNAEVRRQLEKDKSSETALGAFAEMYAEWLSLNLKSVSIDEITEKLGVSKRKVSGAITSGVLRLAPRSKDKVLLSSLQPWLEKNQPVIVEQADEPMLRLVSGD